MKRYSLFIIIVILVIIRIPKTLAGSYQDDFKILLEEETVDELTIVSSGDLKIIKKKNLYYLRKGSLWDVCLDNENNYQIINQENYYLISSIDQDKIRVRKVSKEGKVILNKFIDENKVSSKYDCKYYEGYFYFIGSVEEYSTDKFIQAKGAKNVHNQDAFLIKASEDFNDIVVKIYGGLLNESFKKLLIDKDKLIVVGTKDQLTGGDFGNGGKSHKDNLLVVIIDLHLNILSYKIINVDEDINNLLLKDSLLYIITTNNYICLDSNLEIINSIFLEGINYSYYGNDLFAFFTKSKIYIYNKFSLLFDYDLNLENIVQIIDEDSTFCIYYYQADIIKQMKLDIFWIRNNANNLCVLDYCPLPNETIKIETMFQTAKLINTIVSPFFNRSIHGNYNFDLTFLLRENKQFNINLPFYVSIESNITNGGVYPKGYRLRFTGTAKLNNFEIFNNYPLDQEGSYELVLSDCNGNETIYHFYVDFEQFDFNESVYKTWDMLVSKNARFSINIPLSNEQYENFDYITFSKSYEKIDYIKEEEILKVHFNAPNENGLYVYCLESIKIQDRIYKCNYIYIVNVLKDIPIIEISPSNNNTRYQCSFTDNDQVLRYLEIKVIQNQKEYLYKYPLGNKVLSLSNIDPQQPVNIEISFTYDLGDNIIKSIKLLDAEATTKNNNISIGHIQLQKSSQSVEEIIIELDQNSKAHTMYLIKYNDNDIYYKSNSKKYLLFVVPIVAMFSFFLSRLIKTFRKKRIIKN